MPKMKIKILKNPDKEWDERVLEGGGDIYQTTVYAEFQEKCLNMESEYILVESNSKIVGQLVVTYGPRFSKYLNKRSKFWINFFSKYFKIYTFIRGPIILDKKSKKEIYNCILNYLDKNKNGCFMAQDISLPIAEDTKIHKLFYKKGFYSDSWGTSVLDLTLSEDDLFHKIRRDQRRRIKKDMILELNVKEAKTKKDYNKVIKIIKEMSQRNKIFAHTDNYYLTLFKIFNSHNSLKTFYIEKKGRGIATISLYVYGKNVDRTLVGYTDYDAKSKTAGTSAIEWFAIKWAKENGYKNYDLTGIRPDTTDPKEKGIREYKLRWGGKEVHYPYFSKKYSKLKSFLISLLMILKKWLVRI